MAKPCKDDMAMAYAVKKRAAKKMAKGGRVGDKDPYPQANPSGNGRNQKGVHKEYDKPGQSMARPDTDKPDYRMSADMHKEKLEELRAMKKPNIKGLAEGGRVTPQPVKAPRMVEGSLKVRSRDEADAEIMGPAKAYEDEYHQNRMAKGGDVKDTSDRPDTGWGAIIFKGEGGEVKKSEAVQAPKEISTQPPEQQVLDYKQLRKQYIEKNRMNRRKYAEGGEVELDDEASLAAAIMSKRKRMAEGGMVDIDENAEEQPNAFDELNEDALLKENYDSDMDDIIEPMDSNLMDDPHEMSEEDLLDDDMVSAIRRKMKSRSPITR